ncbi:hypothetical protein VFPPC_15164 [Pochonia chlamydosporia 170]|uniref:Uncharacterized protein n=1 Tax=Pochonia chlamydosporia 170 TaxID=1380566 RepID=A0A179G409_METCM|nr:hypothetical protein VFPPC_15164 [Pochonia chlamydosporia 170]OAQ72595.1 hypothetical protein VFPPC_15164 [Pochonia chlamydosporia 170]
MLSCFLSPPDRVPCRSFDGLHAVRQKIWNKEHRNGGLRPTHYSSLTWNNSCSPLNQTLSC